jgi:hypothetical protein
VERIKQMKKRREKVRSLIERNKTLEQVKSEPPENEAGLIRAIYNDKCTFTNNGITRLRPLRV